MFFRYDPIEYWNARRDPSSADEFYTNAQTSYIRKNIAPTDTILDFGPGTGRVFSAYYANQRVVGVDISATYLRHALDQAHSRRLQYDHILTHRHSSIPVFLRSYFFDVVVFCEVLLHVPSQNIRSLLEQTYTISKKTVIITWEAEHTPPNLAPHCFNHPYEKLFRDVGFFVKDRTLYGNQTFYVVSSKKDSEP